MGEIYVIIQNITDKYDRSILYKGKSTSVELLTKSEWIDVKFLSFAKEGKPIYESKFIIRRYIVRVFDFTNYKFWYM